MLPQILVGSYKRYKEDTNVFTTWLSQSAKACGFNLPSFHPDDGSKLREPTNLHQNPEASSIRLKGKARKEAKKATGKANPSQGNPESNPMPIKKHIVNTKDILNQAEIVARSKRPRIQVPAHILQIAQRSIDARERCFEWFQKTKAKDESSTEGHAHFINILKKAVEILEPCRGSSSTRASKTAIDAKDHKSRDKVSNSSIENRFQGLEVEDTDDLLDIAASEIAAIPSTPSTKVQLSHDVYELESGFDHTFIIFCLFEDLHCMQEFIKETWQKVKLGEFNANTASILTDVAIYLAHRAEEDIIANTPGLPTDIDSYELLTLHIFYADSFSRGEDPMAKIQSSDSLRITPFDDFIYLSTARTLMRFAILAKHKIGYPQPVLPVRFSYISHPELLELPEVKKWEAEHQFLSQLLMDLSFNENIVKAMKESRNLEAPMLDHLSKGLAEVSKGGKITVGVVFAARILLDIQEILGDTVAKMYQELRFAALSADKTLDLKCEGNELIPRSSGELWLTKDSSLVMDIYTLINFQILRYPISEMKRRWMIDHADDENKFCSLQELPLELKGPVLDNLRAKGHDVDSEVDPIYEENAKKIGIHKIEPAKDNEFIFTHNPVYCGIMSFNLAVHMEEAGITLANHHLTIFAFSHLYNALQQLNLISERWKAMDDIIKLHTGVLFCGQLPTTPKEFHTRFALRMGFSATAFARNPRAPHIFPRLGKPGARFAASPTSAIFRHYYDQNEPMEKYLYQLETLFLSTAPGRNPHHRKFLTPLETLTHMSAWLSTNLTDMSIDYITLTRTCNTLLKRVRARLNAQLGTPYADYRGEHSNDPVNVFMVFLMLQEASELQPVVQSFGPGGGFLAGGPQLASAGEVVGGFLKERERGF